MTWTRAVAAGLGTFLVLVLAFFYVPDWILTFLTVASRGVRVWIATAWMALAFGVSCWAALRVSGRGRAEQ